MHRELSKAYEPAEIEDRWARFWVDEHLFDVPTPIGTQAELPEFTQLLPPPNVTGRLHMGHMLNQTEMDILARWHRMRGEISLWVPGTDHAGIATQMMVERQLAAEHTDRHALGREAFINRVWQWKTLYGNAILDQMKRLGASVDWSREYFTMDDRLSVAVREAFVRLYEQGLIYRGERIVNWDPVAQTAVSDVEVEHHERAGHLYEIRYPLADGSGSIVIATTRPETLLGDTAVVVNPTDDRYTSLVGRYVTLPLSAALGSPDRTIPILADDWAKPEFGTGAVKVTPAHDPNDFAIGERHGLPSLTIMDQAAHIDLPGSPYHGLDRMAAREKILSDLAALGLLVAMKDHTLAVATSQRTGAVIEPRLSKQWFLKIQPLADKAIQAVEQGHIRFTPENYRRTYDEWMRNIHDWCLSRQLWWGHRIPAWFCDSCGEITVTRDLAPACPGCGITTIRQETDVLDTWFSSGLLPFTAFGWTGQPSDQHNPDLQAFYPTQLLTTGFDILFFWVARMIMLGTHFMLDVPLPDGSPRSLADAVPFREVYIHALVRDADRQKMSKTKGNVIDPIEIVTRYGTDAVRFTLASMASPGTDIAFSEARTEGNRAFANKIWNAARFLFLQLDRAEAAGYTVPLNATLSTLPSDTPLESRWIVSRLTAVAAEVDRALAAYRFDESASAVYQFFWGELCDWYLELVKLRLDFGDAETPQPQNPTTAVSLTILAGVFETALRLLSPFMPFLTEEIWHALYNGKPPAQSIALTCFPQASDLPRDVAAEAAIATLQELIVAVRALRKELGVPEKESAPIQLHGSTEVLALAKENADMLARMARVSAVSFADQALTGATARSTPSFDVAVLYQRQIEVPAERERLTKELARLEKNLAAASRQLANESFMAKAPAHIVEGLRKQETENRALFGKAKAALDTLPPAPPSSDK